MGLTRTTVTDDDGTGTFGTIINAAQRTADLDMIDARWSKLSLTLTGTQNNLSITTGSVEADFIRMNPASALTITGVVAPVSPAKPGKTVTFKNVSNQIVTFPNASGSSSAANQLFLPTAGTIQLGARGWIAFQYNSDDVRWDYVGHDQGTTITRTFAAGNYTAATGTWTVASAARDAFRLSGRELKFWFNVTGTTSNSTASITIALPNSYAAQGASTDVVVCYISIAGTVVPGLAFMASGNLAIQRLDGAAIAAATVVVAGCIHGEIQ